MKIVKFEQKALLLIFFFSSTTGIFPMMEQLKLMLKQAANFADQLLLEDEELQGPKAPRGVSKNRELTSVPSVNENFCKEGTSQTYLSKEVLDEHFPLVKEIEEDDEIEYTNSSSSSKWEVLSTSSINQNKNEESSAQYNQRLDQQLVFSSLNEGIEVNPHLNLWFKKKQDNKKKAPIFLNFYSSEMLAILLKQLYVILKQNFPHKKFVKKYSNICELLALRLLNLYYNQKNNSSTEQVINIYKKIESIFADFLYPSLCYLEQKNLLSEYKLFQHDGDFNISWAKTLQPIISGRKSLHLSHQSFKALYTTVYDEPETEFLQILKSKHPAAIETIIDLQNICLTISCSLI